MNRRLTWGVTLALLALLGCQGGATRPSASSIRLTDFTTGQPVTDITVEATQDGISLRYAALGPAGSLIHLALPAGQVLAGSAWSERAGLLQLVAPVPGGADIGIVPLPGRAPAALSLHLRLLLAGRSASTPPSGPDDALIDLALEQGGAGQVRLSWTEVNRGDYDFNGEVNIADLVPLAKFFAQHYDNTAPDEADHPLYWVDGDGNGEVGLSDLTVIARHYLTQLNGYNVERNGVVQQSATGDFPTLRRELATPRLAQQLPPRYVIVLDGSPVDNWNVIPLDSGGNPGPGNVIPPVPVDLSVKFSCAGLNLFDQNGDSPGTSAPGHSRLRIVSNDAIMRVIDPGDEPYVAEIGDAIGATTGSAGFNGLPRGQWLLLQVLLAPTVDPVTGQPLAWPTDGSPPHYIALQVPVKLPVGTLVSELTLSAAFTRLPGGTYTVRIASQLRAGPLHLDTLSQLDFAAALATADTDGGQTFADELHLADPRLAGLSTARLQQLQDDNDYAGGTRQSATVTGRFNALNEPDGFLTTDSTQLTVAGKASYQGTLSMRLNELTSINEAIQSSTGEVLHEIGPADLRPGDNLRLSGYLLDGAAGLPARLWVTGITRVVDIAKPDKLYAWPEKTEAYPGEGVTITVSTDQSAQPLFALRGVRVTYNNASYVPNSFNAGAPGGARDDVDGVWSALGATALAVTNEFAIQEVPLPDGRTALDFYVIPQDGTEVPAATGALLNFKLSILGPVTLGIQRLDTLGVKRSFYSDLAGNEYFWSDDYNAGVPMITVKDPGGPGGP